MKPLAFYGLGFHSDVDRFTFVKSRVPSHIIGTLFCRRDDSDKAIVNLRLKVWKPNRECFVRRTALIRTVAGSILRDFVGRCRADQR